MKHNRSNLWKIYLYKFLSDFWLIAPIMIPFYKANHLSTTQFFIVQSAYMAGVLVFEIPSGFFSDVIGRKKTLILGAFFIPIGLGVYAFTSGFAGFIAAEVILSIGASMRSGTDSAFIYDTLLQLGEESQYPKSQGTADFYTRLGTSTSSIGGGLLALILIRLPFYVNIGSGVGLVILSLYLTEPQREKFSTENPFKDILKIVKYCITHAQIRSLMLYTSLLLSTGIIGVWSYYIYYEELGLSIGLNGVLFALFGLCSGFGARHSHDLEGKLGHKKALFLLLVISAAFAALGLGKSLFLIPVIFLAGFMWGFSGPMLLNYLNRLTGSEIRATVLSVNSMAGNISFIILSPLFGAITDRYSLSAAYLAMAVYFLLAALLATFLLLKHRVIST